MRHALYLVLTALLGFAVPSLDSISQPKTASYSGATLEWFRERAALNAAIDRDNGRSDRMHQRMLYRSPAGSPAIFAVVRNAYYHLPSIPIGFSTPPPAPVTLTVDTTTTYQTWQAWQATAGNSDASTGSCGYHSGCSAQIPDATLNAMLDDAANDLGITRFRLGFFPAQAFLTVVGGSPYVQTVNGTQFDFSKTWLNPDGVIIDSVSAMNRVILRMKQRVEANGDTFSVEIANGCTPATFSTCFMDTSAHYADTAQAFVQWFHDASNGGGSAFYPSLFALANEPGSHGGSWDVGVATGQLSATATRFSGASIPTKFAISESENALGADSFFTGVMADGTVAGWTILGTYHGYESGYDGSAPPTLSDLALFASDAAAKGVPAAMTERCCFTSVTGDYTQAKDSVRDIFWNMTSGQIVAWEPEGLWFTCNGTLGGCSGTPNKQDLMMLEPNLLSYHKYPVYWGVRQMSRYIRPGDVRVDISCSGCSNPSQGISVKSVAFKKPDGRVIVSVFNDSGSTQSVTLAGMPAGTYDLHKLDPTMCASDPCVPTNTTSTENPIVSMPTDAIWTFEQQAPPNPPGGIQAPAPWPDQFGANEALNPDFNGNLNNWVATGTVAYDPAVSCGGSVGSAKLSPGAEIEQHNISAGGMEGFLVRYWVTTEAGYDGGPQTPYVEDSTHVFHGSSFINMDPGPNYLQVGAASPCVQVAMAVLVPENHRNDTLWRVHLRPNMAAWTTGNIWITHVEFLPWFRSLRAFMSYPNSTKGLLWSDKTPTVAECGGTPVQGQACFVAELVPRTGESLSDYTLTTKMCSVSGCGSGVLATKTSVAPAALVHTNFTPADYGTLTVGDAYYVDTALTVTSGGATVETWPEYVMIYENPAYRSGLMAWVDTDGFPVVNGVKKSPYGWFNSADGTTMTGSSDAAWATGVSCTPNQASAKLCYENNIQGVGPNTVSPSVAASIPSLTYFLPTYSPNFMRSMQSMGDNIVMFDIQTTTELDPRPGSDQVSPIIDGLQDYGLNLVQIVNTYTCSPVNDLCTAGGVAPTVSITPSYGAGSIADNYLHLRFTYTKWTNVLQGHSSCPGGLECVLESLPSGVTTLHLAGETCAGACAVTFTLPACGATVQNGIYVYYATSSGATPPALSTFQRQPISVTGNWVEAQDAPCGTPVTLSTLKTTGIGPTTTATSQFSTDQTVDALTSWGISGGLTGTQVLTDMVQTLGSASHPGAMSVWVIDEPIVPSARNAFWFKQTVNVADPGVLVHCNFLTGAAPQMWRDVCDIMGVDVYYEGATPGSEEGATIPALGAGTWSDTIYTTNNATTSAGSYPDRMDAYVGEIAKTLYGSRPFIATVLEGPTSGGINGIPYAALRESVYRGYTDCSAFGLACGVMKWVYGSASGGGTTQNYLPVGSGGYGNTNVYTDLTTLGTEWTGLASYLTRSVLDSSGLSATSGTIDSGVTLTGGSVLASMSTNLATNTDCGAPSVYAGLSFGGFRIFTKQSATGAQLIGVSHLCPGTAVATLTAAALPSGVITATVHGEARTRPITAGAWTDTFTGLQTHYYTLTPAGGTGSVTVISGSARLAGAAKH